MTWVFTADVTEFARVAGPELQARPEENTIALSVTEDLLARGNAPDRSFFGWWNEAAFRPGAGGAVLRTPPFPLLLIGLSGQAEADLLQALPSYAGNIRRLSGEVGSVDRIAAQWCRLHDGRKHLLMSQRLYRLGRLAKPTVDGTARAAGDQDAELAVSWFDAFVAESEPGSGATGAIMLDRLSAGLVMLWSDERSRPVAMAARNRTAAGVCRVGPVYTPPEHRGNGYASAATAAASSAALESGAESVVLFTDLANPTSNSIYQRIGYRPVSDRAIVEMLD
jgi:GNAT superfamily N-acetyltransferase